MQNVYGSNIDSLFHFILWGRIPYRLHNSCHKATIVFCMLLFVFVLMNVFFCQKLLLPKIFTKSKLIGISQAAVRKEIGHQYYNYFCGTENKKIPSLLSWSDFYNWKSSNISVQCVDFDTDRYIWKMTLTNDNFKSSESCKTKQYSYHWTKFKKLWKCLCLFSNFNMVYMYVIPFNLYRINDKSYSISVDFPKIKIEKRATTFFNICHFWYNIYYVLYYTNIS